MYSTKFMKLHLLPQNAALCGDVGETMPLFSLKINSVFKRGIVSVDFIGKVLAHNVAFVNM